MKRHWTADELTEHWTLHPLDLALLANKSGATRLGFALLLKFFQYEARFPQKTEIPGAVIVHVAQHLSVPPELYAQYEWTGRTMEYHRAQIRDALGFRAATAADADDLAAWLVREVLPHEHRSDRVQQAVYARCRASHIEPPTSGRIDRLMRSALYAYEEGLYRAVYERLGSDGVARIDTLLAPDGAADDDASAESRAARLTLVDLKADPGRPTLDNVLAQIARLQRVRQLGLPPDLFADVAPKVIHVYRQRAAAESASALRAHPPVVRATLVAALCLVRQQELTDGLIDVLVALVHKIGARAEQRVVRELLADLKRVSGKTNILYHVAEACVEQPDDLVRNVVYPAAGGEQTLRDLVREYKASGPAYRLHVQTRLRASYRSHYRRALPALLDALEFRSNNVAHQPIIEALALLKRYATSKARLFEPQEQVPLDEVVPPGWLDTVVRPDARGRQRIDRINYEICVLQTLREKLRCREVWVVGADRYRNYVESVTMSRAA